MPFFVNYIRTKSLCQSPYINEKRPKIDIATTRLNRPWADSVNYFFVLFLIGHAVFVNLFSQFAYFLDEFFSKNPGHAEKSHLAGLQTNPIIRRLLSH